MSHTLDRLDAIDAQLGELAPDMFRVAVDRILPRFGDDQPPLTIETKDCDCLLCFHSGAAPVPIDATSHEVCNTRCLRSSCSNTLPRTAAWYCDTCRPWINGIIDEDPLGIGEPQDFVPVNQITPLDESDRLKAHLERYDGAGKNAATPNWKPDSEDQWAYRGARRMNLFPEQRMELFPLADDEVQYRQDQRPIPTRSSQHLTNPNPSHWSTVLTERDVEQRRAAQLRALNDRAEASGWFARAIESMRASMGSLPRVHTTPSGAVGVIDAFAVGVIDAFEALRFIGEPVSFGVNLTTPCPAQQADTAPSYPITLTFCNPTETVEQIESEARSLAQAAFGQGPSDVYAQRLINPTPYRTLEETPEDPLVITFSLNPDGTLAGGT